ncbi:hypothetical protein TPA0910_36400 [Streptomyces hygroscopicus subsp. sporocinereus]|uniref:Uncharacterized protein n=1 Tax=Streptomyces hygroscopicus TaxID=1912 RepID=A0ABQ3U0R8_STRHY|nr:hypothetical protein [Streptomyces hygroscopicus]GHJ29207.1 hypothetical protein TPA0910_36400 [Streptomyces hygroscopicus]
MPEERPTMPPVRLRSDAELARDALAAPLLSRAVRLARWAEPGKPVAPGGALPEGELRAAVELLELAADEDGPVYAAQAWQLAVDIGLVEIREPGESSEAEGSVGAEVAAGAEGSSGPSEAEVAAGAGGSSGTETATGAEVSSRSGESSRPGDRSGDRPGASLPPEASSPAGDDGFRAAGGAAAGGEFSAVATSGEELRLITEGGPRDILDLWLDGFETVLADAAAPDLADIADQLSEDGELDLDALDWNPEEEAEFLDGVLGNLYLLTALDEEAAVASVPLPALAASMIVPEDMDEPTDDVLEEISEAMVRLDDQFRLLAPTGLIDYQPVDEALIEEVDGEGRIHETEPVEELEDEDVSRYGMVRLTPLGVYAVRSRMAEAGIDAPAVGDLADKGADILLDALPGHPEPAAQAEAEQWLARRTPEEAARELLAAARGDDESAPLRRLTCQQTLSLVGTAAEPALREVLDDRHLGGLARVWLAEHGASGVPEPSEEMVFWLTVDTLAAQLATEGDSAELRDLVRGLVDQSGSFFDSAWRVDHPATAEVLEAMGRLHPDKKAAKEARKAAFKARSRA